MDRVSFHTTVDKFGDRNVYQIFLGSPKRYQEPDVSRLEGIDKDIVIHSPYWVNMAKESTDKNYMATLLYSVKVAREMQKVNQKYYVTHVGARFSDMTVSRSMDCIRDFCLRWLWDTRDTDVILCLENDSGSKKGTKMGSVKILSKIIRDINSPRIRMTFDCEHAFANGFDLSDIGKLENIKDIVSVVHFNSIPDMVGRGSHIDRHSQTKFEESKYSFDYLFNVYDVMYDGIRPFIMEIDNELAEDNLSYLNTYLVSREWRC